MAMILVVEDNRKIRANLLFQLEDAGYTCEGLPSAEEALDWLGKHGSPDLLLLDVRLERMTGVDLVRILHEKACLPPTIIVSGEASISETVDALKYGVYDFIEKPVSNERLLQSVKNCLEVNQLKANIRALKAAMPGRGTTILGTSAGVVRLRQLIERVAPTQGRVLVRGESGTGKELVAACIHENSPRAAKPFVKVNCAAIPSHLIEAELFGHVRGAFTDARNDKQGLFEQAHTGTLFLDEIGDMDVQLQARLLRVLEDSKVRRVGDTRDRDVDVRVIAATHCQLEQMVEEKRFREDLYFRLSAIPIDVPPLRERSEDIPLLFAHFMEVSSRINNLPNRRVDPEAMAVLMRHSWPGNIRELKNIAERVVIFGGDPITVDQLPTSMLRESATPLTSGLLQPSQVTRFVSLRDFKTQCEKEYLELVLHKTNWNVSETARILDIQRPHLHQKLNQLGLQRPE